MTPYHVYQHRDRRLLVDESIDARTSGQAATLFRRRHSTLDGDVLVVHDIRRGGECRYRCNGTEGTGWCVIALKAAPR